MDGRGMMTHEQILRRVDHTMLSPAARLGDIIALCDDARNFGTASVCVPPSFVARAGEYLAGEVAVCTVIGFPNGYNTSRVKAYECEAALEDGADEIDTVINIGDLKDKNYQKILSELRELKAICGKKILKVIIETCLLDDSEKIKMCEIVTESGADFIKTSTGFSTGGATLYDIRLFARHIGTGVKIKAAGGIKSFEDAERFIKAGASRLGTSALVKLMKNQTAGGY